MIRDRIRGYAAAVFESADANNSRSNVASDLEAFARVLSSSDALRSALTDATLSPEVRRAIVVDLVGDKASPYAAGLLSFAVRYERASELSSAINTLVAESEAPSDGALDEQAGREAVRERIRGYAERVLQEGESLAVIDEIEDELFRFARILDDNPDLRRALQDTNTALSARLAILSDILETRVHPETLRIARYVLRVGRSRDLVGVFEWLVELAAAERGRRVGEVRAAVPLDAAERERLASALSRLVERPVEIREIHDPKVIGGMLVSVGDLVIDSTVRIRFERLRDLLAEAV